MTAPEVAAVRSVLDWRLMLAAADTLMAATLSASPELVANRSPLRKMLPAPVLVSAITPLPPAPAVMLPSVTLPLELRFRVTSLPALRVPPVTVAALLVMVMLPLGPAALMDVKSTVPGALSATLPEVAVMAPPNAPMLLPAVKLRLTALTDRLSPSDLKICPAVAVMPRLPTALMVLAITPPAPPSLTLRLTSRAASKAMPPLPSAPRLVPELTRMSRPAVTLMPGCAGSRPLLVEVMLPPRLMSLAAPVLVRATTPLEAVSAPRPKLPAPSTKIEVPAPRAPVLTPAPALMSIEPALAPSVSTVMVEPALSTMLPVLATTLPPMGPMLVPALSVIALAKRLIASPSLREIELPALMSMLPAALMALAITPPAPPSLTLRFTAPAAFKTMAPVVVAVRLVLEASRMSRPETMLIAGALSARPVLVACRLALRVMSPPAALLVSEIKPFADRLPATVSEPACAVAMMAFAVICPSDRLPAACVMARLPLVLMMPAPWLKLLLTVTLPLPVSSPEFRASCTKEVAALAVSVPPLKVASWVNAEGPARLRLPAEKMKFSSALSWLAATAPDTVMFCKPATLMLTFCPAAGALPVLQLAPTLQSPEVPIQHTSTTQPLCTWNTAVVAP